MTQHDLRTWPEFFVAVVNGDKTFELRKDDRSFAVGDTLVLREWNKDNGQYTGGVCKRAITYVLRDFPGIEKGYVILGLSDEW